MTDPDALHARVEQWQKWFDRISSDFRMPDECRADALIRDLAAEHTRLNDLFSKHTQAVSEFLNELYAIMVDPCAEGSITVKELKAALVAAAIRDRDAEVKFTAEYTRLREELSAIKERHDKEKASAVHSTDGCDLSPGYSPVVWSRDGDAGSLGSPQTGVSMERLRRESEGAILTTEESHEVACMYVAQTLELAELESQVAALQAQLHAAEATIATVEKQLGVCDRMLQDEIEDNRVRHREGAHE